MMIDSGNDCCQSRLWKENNTIKNKKKLKGGDGGDLLRPVGREWQKKIKINKNSHSGLRDRHKSSCQKIDQRGCCLGFNFVLCFLKEEERTTMNTFFRRKRQDGQEVFVLLKKKKRPLVLSSRRLDPIHRYCIIYPETVVAGVVLSLCLSQKKKEILNNRGCCCCDPCPRCSGSLPLPISPPAVIYPGRSGGKAFHLLNKVRGRHDTGV